MVSRFFKADAKVAMSNLFTQLPPSHFLATLKHWSVSENCNLPREKENKGKTPFRVNWREVLV
jgi:hypothetical protein